MILFFFIHKIFASYGAIDLGTQYIKVSIMDLDGNIKIVPNSQNKMMTPSAVAFKLDNYPNRHLTNIEALKVPIKVGDDALRLLKKKPEYGSAFVPRLIGRKPSNNSNFNFPPFVNASEMLALLIKDIYLSPELQNVPGSVVAVPAYYTYDQRTDVVDAMWAAELGLYSVIDDNQAIATLYSIRFAKRFSENPQSILFVDAGATSIKAYRGVFSMNSTTNPPTPLVNLTSYEWSESCGSEYFALKYSKSKNISVKKARKQLNALTSLSRGELETLFSDELTSLSQLVKRATNGPIDHVQIFGGASRFSFIVDAIIQAAGGVELRRDLPPNDAIAIGSNYVLMNLNNISLFQFPNLTRSSPYNLFVECNGVTEDYCYKSANCSEAALLENTRCEVFNFFTEKEEVPEGCNELIGRYDLLNISKFPRGANAGGFLVFNPPKPIVTAALWCRNEDLYCLSIIGKASGSSELKRSKQQQFVSTIIKAQSEIQEVSVKKDKIDDLTTRIEKFIENSEDVKVDEAKDDAIRKIEYAREIRNKSNSIKKLVVVEEELKMIARYIGVPINEV